MGVKRREGGLHVSKEREGCQEGGMKRERGGGGGGGAEMPFHAMLLRIW